MIVSRISRSVRFAAAFAVIIAGVTLTAAPAEALKLKVKSLSVHNNPASNPTLYSAGLPLPPHNWVTPPLAVMSFDLNVTIKSKGKRFREVWVKVHESPWFFAWQGGLVWGLHWNHLFLNLGIGALGALENWAAQQCADNTKGQAAGVYPFQHDFPIYFAIYSRYGERATAGRTVSGTLECIKYFPG